MPEISAADVKALRDRTGLPLMECKQALQETQGDQTAAIELLRKQGKKTMASRADRETSEGRMAIYADVQKGVGAMVELQCESDPVKRNEQFIQLGNDLAQQLALGPGAKTPEELLAQPSPSRKGETLSQQMDDVTNQIREVFKLTRIVRIDKPCGGYAHHTGTHGALVAVEGGNQALANEIAMHVTASKPSAVTKEELDPALVDKEREILREAALKEGKPANIVDKMVEGRLRQFYAERVLLEQPFIKDEQKTVGKVAAEGKMKVLQYVNWQLGKPEA